MKTQKETYIIYDQFRVYHRVDKIEKDKKAVPRLNKFVPFNSNFSPFLPGHHDSGRRSDYFASLIDDESSV